MKTMRIGSPMAKAAGIAYLDPQSGKSGNRSTIASARAASRAGAAVGASCRASPAEKARERAAAAPDRSARRRRPALDLLDMRECRHVRPLFDLFRPPARRQIAV